METFETPNGLTLLVHDKGTCRGDYCVIHKPKNTYPRENLWWRSDRGIFEVICAHGVGHPAPEQYDYWEKNNESWQGVHGCDRCCREWQ